MPNPIDKILSLIGLKQRNKMPENKNQEHNNIIRHRYEKVDILTKCLDDFGYKNYKVNDQNRPGIRIWLPNDAKITDEQERKIHKKYVEAHRRANPPT